MVVDIVILTQVALSSDIGINITISIRGMQGKVAVGWRLANNTIVLLVSKC